MRILVFSDSHGHSAPMAAVLAAVDADAVFFLGDGAADFSALRSQFPLISFYSVSGNCDRFSGEAPAKIAKLAGKTVFYTHGHLHEVKYGLEKLRAAAESGEADIVLYGHTHRADTRRENGIWYFNPGSVARPAEGPPSYGIVDITEAGVVPFAVPLESGFPRRIKR